MGIKKYLVSLLSFLIIITTVMPSVFNNSIIKVDAQGTDRIVDNSKVFDDYKKHEIETISPQGTVINLFDYWYADSKSNDGKNMR